MTMTQTRHELQDGDRTVHFNGDLLASASTEDEGKDRWSEMYIYLRSDPGDKYVVYGVGKSKLPGETDRGWVRTCCDADAVIKALTRTSDGVSYMTNANVLLLQRASQIDDALYDASSTQAI